MSVVRLLTRPQQLVLDAFRRRAHEGLPPPTYRELCADFGWRSTGTARDHLRALARKGLVERAAGKARGTRLRARLDSVAHLPLVGRVVAGQPVVSEEHIDEEIPVPTFMKPDGSAFMLRVKGDSMEGAGILDNDIVVVRQTDRASERDIVVVTLEGETTLKRLVRLRGTWFLTPENPRYAPIEVTGHPVVHGVVTGVMRAIRRYGRRLP